MLTSFLLIEVLVTFQSSVILVSPYVLLGVYAEVLFADYALQFIRLPIQEKINYVF